MNDKLREIAIGLCDEHGCRLIYLAKAGSHRYGTSTPNSDADADGIFIPPKEKLLLGERIDHLKYTTKEDKFKNSSDDIDVKIYSIQYFLRNLLKKSDTNAIDILYSHTNESTILHSVEHVGKIFNNKDKLIEISDIMKFSYTAFSISQAKKFGIKSNKLGLMRSIYEYLQQPKYDSIDSLRLCNCIHDLMYNIPKSKFLSTKIINNEMFLILDGKMHQMSISMNEFRDRVYSEYKKYGKRTKLAERNQGIDWKSISHSLRGIYQMEELYHNGYIKFPLKQCDILRDIKVGKYSFDEVDTLISDGLDRLANLELEGSAFKGKRDESFINNLILEVYK